MEGDHTGPPSAAQGAPTTQGPRKGMENPGGLGCKAPHASHSLGASSSASLAINNVFVHGPSRNPPPEIRLVTELVTRLSLSTHPSTGKTVPGTAWWEWAVPVEGVLEGVRPRGARKGWGMAPGA